MSELDRNTQDERDWTDAEATALRATDLLQRYFDDKITDEEGIELLELWDHLPELECEALKHYEINHSLRSLADRGKDRAGFQVVRQHRIVLPPFQSVFSKGTGPRSENDDPTLENAVVAPNWLDDIVILATLSSERSPTDPQTAIRPMEKEKAASPERPLKTLQRDAPGSFLPVGLLVLIVCGLMVFAVYHEFFQVSTTTENPPEVSFHAIAKVTAAVDIRWPDGAEALKEGRQIESGRICFEEGILELLLKNNVRLALEGPVDFQLQSEFDTFCGNGHVSATVPESGKGFTVVTPLLTVVDLGTEFSLNVDRENTETHTIEGMVELSKMPGENVRLSDGDALQIDPRGTVRRFPADPATFLDGKTVRRRLAVRDSRELEVWRAACNDYRDREDLLLDLDFEDDGVVFENRARHAGSSLVSASSRGGRRSTGRWTGKRGIEFRRKNDAVLFAVAEELSSLTLFLSVRIDSLRKYNQALLASRDVHRGDIVWQLKNDGAIQLLIRESESSPPRQFTSSSVLDRRTWGAWYTLAVVIDAPNKRVVHYVDGEPVARLPMDAPLPVQIGEATIGNAFSSDKKATDRSLDGCVDQFILFRRALSDEEIRQLPK